MPAKCAAPRATAHLSQEYRTPAWEQRKLGDILQERNVRTSDFESNPIFSLTIEDGITPKTDRYERTSLITKTEDLFKT